MRKICLALILSGLLLITTACSGTSEDLDTSESSIDYESEFLDEIQQLREYIQNNKTAFLNAYLDPELDPSEIKSPDDYDYELITAGLSPDKEAYCLFKFTSKSNGVSEYIDYTLDSEYKITSCTKAGNIVKPELGTVQTEQSRPEPVYIPEEEPDYTLRPL